MRQIETTVIGTFTDTLHSSEARLQMIAELAKALLKRCPNLKDFSKWGVTVAEDKLTSEFGSAMWQLLHGSRREVLHEDP